MSMKRNNSGRSGASLGGGEVGGKINREDLFEDLKRRSQSGTSFGPVDVALSIGAGEPQVARALLGLAAEGLLQRSDVGRYSANGIAELAPAEFLKAFIRASKLDGARMRDLQEIDRLKKNNDTMRARLLRAQAERDHFKAALDARGIDPGPLPENAALAKAEARLVEGNSAPAAVASAGAASESAASETAGTVSPDGVN